jgi:hypothetical protein
MSQNYYENEIKKVNSITLQINLDAEQNIRNYVEGVYHETP